MEFEEGQLLVLASVGVVRIDAVGDPICAAGGEGEPYEIPLEVAQSRLRAPVSRAVASQVLECFGNSTRDIPKNERARVYRRAHKGGDLRQMAETLASIYSMDAPTLLENRYRTALEKAVFEELSAILEKSVAALKRAARKASRSAAGPAPRYLDAPDRSEALEKASALIDDTAIARTWASFGALYVEESLIVGELASGLTLAARPGVWFVYGDDLDQDAIQTILAVHHQCIDHVDSLSTTETSDVLPINGASMAVTDAWFAEDPDLLRELEHGSESVAGRAINIGLGGDGSAGVQYGEVDGRAVLVRIELR